MIVVGIPNSQERHAEYAADMAIDMLIGLKKVELPFLEGKITVKLGEQNFAYFFIIIKSIPILHPELLYPSFDVS